MYININERVDVNQDGSSLIIEAPPPPPEPPNNQKIFMFSYMKNLLSIVFPWGTYVSSVETLLIVPWIQHMVSQNRQKWKTISKTCSSDYFHILHVVEKIALVWNLFQNVRGALKHQY